MRWAGLVGSMAVLAMVSMSGCKEKTAHITVVQPERTVVREQVVVREVPAPAPLELAPEVEALPPALAPAPAPVVMAPALVVVEPVVVQPASTINVSFFHESLGHHGHWITVASYGQVWVPVGVAAGWQPYTLGHWVLTDANGWMWVSDEPFGWATYHYGRWTFVESHGWVWIPGTVWGPAWVVWRNGGGYVGWAPMPPAAIAGPIVESSTEVNINININVVNHIRPHHWIFVEEKHILESVHTHIVISKKSDWIINVTRPSTHVTVISGRVINRSLAIRDVERATGRPVRTMRVREVDAEVNRDARMTVKGDEVVVPRARVRPGTNNARTESPAPSRGNAQPPDAGRNAQPSRSGVTRQPARTNNGPTRNSVDRTTEVKPASPAPSEPARNPAPGRTGAAIRDQIQQPQAPVTPDNTRGAIERKNPRLDPQPAPAERPADVTRKPADLGRQDRTRKPQAPAKATPPVVPSGASRSPAGAPGTVRQGPAATDVPAVPPPTSPTPGANRRSDVSRQTPAAREGRDANVERSGPRRPRTDTPPTVATPAPEQPQPSQPSGERPGTVRRAPAARPDESVSGDAGSRVRGSDEQRDDVRRKRARTAERRGEEDKKDRNEQPAE